MQRIKNQSRITIERDRLHEFIEDMSAEHVRQFKKVFIDKQKKAREFSRKYKFTGYYQNGTTKIFGMMGTKNKDDLFDPKLIYRVKGGTHSVINMYLNFEERKRLAVEHAKMLGFKVRKRGNAIEIYIPDGKTRPNRPDVSLRNKIRWENYRRQKKVITHK